MSPPRAGMARIVAVAAAVAAAGAAASCSGGGAPTGTKPIQIASIVIDGGARAVELGTVLTLTATARNAAGAVVSVPFAWRSTVDSVVSIGRDGKLTALDTGSAFVTASALGVSSANVQIVVVWLGAANVAPVQFTVPNAVSPGAEMKDSLRVLVTNRFGAPSVGAKVAFAVAAGGGTVSPASPALVTVGQSGIASAKWTLGPATGKNTVTATVVVDADSQPNARVKGNPVSFTVTSYNPLLVVDGDNQTGSVLSPLPVAPSIRLVDTAGKPRAGIPVSFAPTGNGRVANAVASTTADGVASPGIWTLGDISGDEQLVVTVEAAKLVLHATATGNTVRLSASKAAAAQNATCVLTPDQFASCFGQAPQIGTGDTTSKATPTLTQGSIKFTSLAGGGAHFCGTTSDLSLYCWGINAFVDTTGRTTSTSAPTRLPSNVAWVQVSPGGQHNCALANDGTGYCWGANPSGQLGDNTTSTRFKPAPVAGGFKFTTLASGGSHSCGVTVDAAAFCWGANAAGQLGDGTQTNRLTPTAVSGDTKWKAVGAGAAWTCGLDNGGVAYCWGAGAGRVTPGSYTGAPLFASLSVGSAHACALAADGTAYCWGDNSSGQLGDSTTISRAAPTAVSTELRFSAISAGFQHTCGVTTDGFVACWGRNVVGELGTSAVGVQTTPRYVILEVKP